MISSCVSIPSITWCRVSSSAAKLQRSLGHLNSYNMPVKRSGWVVRSQIAAACHDQVYEKLRETQSKSSQPRRRLVLRAAPSVSTVRHGRQRNAADHRQAARRVPAGAARQRDQRRPNHEWLSLGTGCPPNRCGCSGTSLSSSKSLPSRVGPSSWGPRRPATSHTA